MEGVFEFKHLKFKVETGIHHGKWLHLQDFSINIFRIWNRNINPIVQDLQSPDHSCAHASVYCYSREEIFSTLFDETFEALPEESYEGRR